MRKIIVFVFVLAAAVCAAWAIITACNNGSLIFKSVTPSQNMISREFDLGDFDEIETSRVNIEYTVGTSGKAILTAPDNVIEDITVTVKEGDLKVFVNDKTNYKGALNATLTVSSSHIKDISASLSARVNVNSPVITCKNFDLYASTSSSINIDSIVCDEAEIQTKTSGAITIDNLQCSDKAFLKASTSAGLEVKELIARKIEAESSTSASINVNGGKTTKIDLDASTSSKIEMLADYEFGKADASTSGLIKLGIDRLSERATSTHGRIKVR